MTGPTRCARAGLVAGLVAVGLQWAAPAAGAATPVEHEGAGRVALASIRKGPDSVQLLSQTPWVGPGSSEFEMRLSVTASDAADEALAVVVYGPALTTRSQFDDALTGQDLPSPVYDPSPVPLGRLTSDGGGGTEVEVPLSTVPLSSPGIYPVQAFLEKSGARVGEALTSFLVYASSGAVLHRLNVGVVVPLDAGVPVRVSGAVGPATGAPARLVDQDASELVRYGVPVTVQASVPTLEALAGGTPAQKLALARLRGAVAAGDELLPATALPVDLGAMAAAGLSSWVRAEVGTGASELGTLLGANPSPATWVLQAGANPATVQVLQELGAKRVVVPADELSALPPADQMLTFAVPTELGGTGAPVEVLGADSELASRLQAASMPRQAALVANQVLAELAMIELERPSDRRAVVLLPPPGTELGPDFLSVLLPGLQGNPLLRPMTLSGLFEAVGLASAGSSGTAPLVRYLPGPRASKPLGGAGQLPAAAREVSAASQVFGPRSRLVSALGERIFVSLSSSWSPSRRRRLLAGAASAARAELAKLRLPPHSSITLTALQGRLPLSLLSTSLRPARVRLVLTSEQLSFRPERSPHGTCHPVGTGSESCQLVLDGATTALEVPVAVRSPGTFQLSLQLLTPDGTVQLATGADTVQSLVTPNVGLALMVGAALFLAVWWVRNARHGRRARRLVPRPPDDDPLPPAGVQGRV
jgi:hypothetical protein